MRSIIATAALLLIPAFSMAQNSSSEDIEAAQRADLAEAEAANIARVLMTSPALMQTVVNDALREKPDVVKSIIRDTLLNNPEIIVGAIQEFQKQQEAGTAKAAPRTVQDLDPDLVAEMRSGDNAHVGGNPNGTVTITEFFDYNCGYCRAFAPVLEELVASNDHLRVVYREWPALGADSADVARLALAARQQDAYKAFHDALMNANEPLNEGRALLIAANLGLDIEKLERDSEHPIVTQHISRSVVMAKQAGFQGTPSMLVGDRLGSGLASVEQIQPILDAFDVK